jgi:hypothetical protein
VRRRALAWGLVAAASGLAAVGCDNLRGTVAPNQPPETTLWVTGDLDVVGHAQRFYWDGEDPDGSVEGFEFKWIYEAGAEPAGYDSSLWTYTVYRDSLFVVYVPTGADFPTFTVRAIDDQGAADPTPARQQYRFKNEAPTVMLSGTPADTTFPVATLAWSAVDPDGNINNAKYRVWLAGKEAQAEIVTDLEYTLLPGLFQDAGGSYVAGTYKAYVTAIDDGGRMSLPDSFSWYVKLPLGEVLLVDDVPSTVAGAATYDNFYRTELNNRLGAGTYSLVDIENGSPFRAEADVRETFLFFRHVFWYSEVNTGISADGLALVGEAIPAHLSAGNNLFLTSGRLVGTSGVLDDSFVRDVLGANGLYMNVRYNPPTTNFSIGNGRYLAGGSSPFDSLRSAGIFGEIEALDLADLGEAAYLAYAGTLDTLNASPWPVGVSRTYGSGSGRIVYLSFPLRLMNASFGPGQPGRSAVELGKVFTLFGIP